MLERGNKPLKRGVNVEMGGGGCHFLLLYSLLVGLLVNKEALNTVVQRYSIRIVIYQYWYGNKVKQFCKISI